MASFRVFLSALEEVTRNIWSKDALICDFLESKSSDADFTFKHYFRTKYLDIDCPELSKTELAGAVDAVRTIISTALDTESNTISSKIIDVLCESKTNSQFLVAKSDSVEYQSVQVIYLSSSGVKLLDLYFQNG